MHVHPTVTRRIILPLFPFRFVSLCECVSPLLFVLFLLLLLFRFCSGVWSTRLFHSAARPRCHTFSHNDREHATHTHSYTVHTRRAHKNKERPPKRHQPLSALYAHTHTCSCLVVVPHTCCWNCLFVGVGFPPCRVNNARRQPHTMMDTVRTTRKRTHA